MKTNIEYWKKVKSINSALGLKPRSLTGQKYVDGNITWDQAKYIANFIKYRHEKTNYELLLEAGMNRNEARKKMRLILEEEKENIIPLKKSPKWENYIARFENLKRVLGYNI